MPSSVSEGKKWISGALEKLHRIKPLQLVLDVGCGEGTYSNLFRHKFSNAEWWGIEVFAPYLVRYRLADKYDKVINQDVSDFIQKHRSRRRFSVVILGDVLEHLREREAIRIYRFFAARADLVVISIPIVPYPQGTINGNPYEIHLTENWTHESVLRAFPGQKRWYRGNVVGCYLSGPCLDETLWAQIKPPSSRPT